MSVDRDLKRNVRGQIVSYEIPQPAGAVGTPLPSYSKVYITSQDGGTTPERFRLGRVLEGTDSVILNYSFRCYCATNTNVRTSLAGHRWWEFGVKWIPIKWCCNTHPTHQQDNQRFKGTTGGVVSSGGGGTGGGSTGGSQLEWVDMIHMDLTFLIQDPQVIKNEYMICLNLQSEI